MRDLRPALPRFASADRGAMPETGYWETTLSTGKHHQPLWRVHSDTVNVQWLAQHLAPSDGVLLKTDLFDEALADGLCPYLSARCRTVVGIDLANATVRAARARDDQLSCATADVRRLPFVSDSIDVVVSTSTLDHFASVAEIAASLAELQRVLRPGGQLLLTLDNLANPMVAVRNTLPFRPLNALGIVPFRVGATCTPQALQRLLRQAQFDILDIGAILHCPRVLAVAGAALLHRVGSPRMQQIYLRCLMRFEGLAAWPSRFRTGYFISVVARKPR